MTKRRPSNKKPTGLNASLGNSLRNHRERARIAHRIAKNEDDIDCVAFLPKEEKEVVDSITAESGLEEFLAKAKLADTDFTADRANLQIVSGTTSVIIPSREEIKENHDFQAKYENRLCIPRDPMIELFNGAESTSISEDEAFLEWRRGLEDLQKIGGITLTPFEKNLNIWREFWKVARKSHVMVQVIDARNPLLFRSKALERYMYEFHHGNCQNVLLVNKCDLVPRKLLALWAQYFADTGINAIFWSAVPEEEMPVHSQKAEDDDDSFHFITKRENLISHLAQMRPSAIPKGTPFNIGIVGYPNVGKSSTINKLIDSKKVSVSATPGKTKHYQTIKLSDDIMLYDSPGLVMPSFSFSKDEMILTGILPVDQLRDHFGPAALLLSRVPRRFIEATYSIILPQTEEPSAINLLTTLAFSRGFMAASGIPDCSRAARLLIKDVLAGKILWAVAPPTVESTEDIDRLIYPVEDKLARPGTVQLIQMEAKGLLESESTRDARLDTGFFSASPNLRCSAHIRAPNVSLNSLKSGKKHNNVHKKEKLRRICASNL